MDKQPKPVIQISQVSNFADRLSLDLKEAVNISDGKIMTEEGGFTERIDGSTIIRNTDRMESDRAGKVYE